jgi:hypothetical protein
MQSPGNLKTSMKPARLLNDQHAGNADILPKRARNLLLSEAEAETEPDISDGESRR